MEATKPSSSSVLNPPIFVSRALDRSLAHPSSSLCADHFAKPDLTVDATIPPSAFQTAYISSLFALALLPNVYLKLSALLDSADIPTVQNAFKEYKEGNSTRSKRKGTSYETLLARIRTYLEPAIEAFGEGRILVGSGKTCLSFSIKLLSLLDPSS